MSEPHRVICFLSDFGQSDAYVGIVKAVMEGIAPGVRVIDLAHDLPPQDLRCAAYQLFEATPYVPAGSVVLAVVDPGVGSARRAVVVEGRRLLWVVPDNGLLTLACEHDPPSVAFELAEPSFQLPELSRTFHGRDVFGPAAAHLARGVPPERFGPSVDPSALVRLPVSLGPGPRGEVLTFDRFGNAITTLRPEGAPTGRLRVGAGELPVGSHYAEVAPGEALALVGSAGLLEIAVRQGSARRVLGLAPGDRVELNPGAAAPAS